MTVDDLTPQEIAAALAARRELGPEYEHEIAAALADKMERRIDAEVQARTAAGGGVGVGFGGGTGTGPGREAAAEPTTGQHQLALADAMTARVTAVASLIAGTAVTLGVSGQDQQHGVVSIAWFGIMVINVAVNFGRRRRRNRP
ncbi:hypothetical protein [Catenulispora pinisilvae]|uniref:hypothetical protein n=1 Tax=Catenulispora pinisilvae TaxID=2705253 RepID=UPI001892877F|nr:hypothetical protein [Catenulispora pinisilvae]